MAKELGIRPETLVKSAPPMSSRWKAPIGDWIRDLYAAHVRSQPATVAAPETAVRPNVVEFRNPDHVWPDNPQIKDRFYDEVEYPDTDDIDEDFDNFYEPPRGEPSEEEADEESNAMVCRQRLYRWAAEAIANSWSALPEVQKVAAFGAASQPLQMEVPRFSQFRRHGIEILHECGDLDLAVWTTNLASLQQLKKAMNRALVPLQNTPYGGMPNHAVDVHVFDVLGNSYKGRLCQYGQCPKPEKRDCLVPGCGAHPFLQQFADYRFRQAQFDREPKVVLFDRSSGFLVRPPRTEGKLAKPRPRRDSE
jgi:hypothetical protein